MKGAGNALPPVKISKFPAEHVTHTEVETQFAPHTLTRTNVYEDPRA